MQYRDERELGSGQQRSLLNKDFILQSRRTKNHIKAIGCHSHRPRMKQNTADFVDCFQLNLMNRKVEQAMLKKMWMNGQGY